MFNFILHYLEQINHIAPLLIALLTLAEWIRKLRREKIDCTQEAFAELLGVEPRTVQRWEQGKRTPRQEHLLMMQEMNYSKAERVLEKLQRNMEFLNFREIE